MFTWWKSALVLVVLMSIVTLPVHAQSASLGVTSKLSFDMAPGATETTELYVKNSNPNQAVKLTLTSIDLTFKDSSGVPLFIDQSGTVPTRWSIGSMLGFEPTLELKAGESRQIQLIITVPKQQLPGSYYGAIRYTPVTNGTGSVGLVASNTTLLFLNVRGKANQLARVHDVGFKQTMGGPAQSWYLNAPPKVVAYTIKNNGNTIIEPGGSVTVTSLFGNQSHVLPILNTQNERALIGQDRQFAVCFKAESKTGTCQSFLHPGIFRVTWYIAYAFPGGETHDYKVTYILWYFPWWLLLLAVIVLLIMIFGLWHVYFWYRHAKKPKSKRVRRFTV